MVVEILIRATCGIIGGFIIGRIFQSKIDLIIGTLIAYFLGPLGIIVCFLLSYVFFCVNEEIARGIESLNLTREENEFYGN